MMETVQINSPIDNCQYGVRVKNIWYREPSQEERKECPTWTGITFQLVNGLIFTEHSTDIVKPYSIFNHKK